jgi:hypothetical protein
MRSIDFRGEIMTLRYAHLTPNFIVREIDLLDIEPSLVRPREEARL